MEAQERGAVAAAITQEQGPRSDATAMVAGGLVSDSIVNIGSDEGGEDGRLAKRQRVETPCNSERGANVVHQQGHTQSLKAHLDEGYQNKMGNSLISLQKHFSSSTPSADKKKWKVDASSMELHTTALIPRKVHESYRSLLFCVVRSLLFCVVSYLTIFAITAHDQRKANCLPPFHASRIYHWRNRRFCHGGHQKRYLVDRIWRRSHFKR